MRKVYQCIKKDGENGPLLNEYYIEQSTYYDTLNLRNKCFIKKYVENNSEVWRLVKNFKKELNDLYTMRINIKIKK